MKEITTEITLKLTFIEKVPDDMVDCYTEKEKNPANKIRYEQMVAKELVANKADIRSIKHVVADLPDEYTEIFFDDTTEESSLYPSLVNSFLLSNPKVKTELLNYIEERLKERCKV